MTQRPDSQAEEYEAFEFEEEADSNIQRSLAPLDEMGCFYLLFHSAMVCVKELNIVFKNAIERRRQSTYYNNNNNEENVSLLTDIMEDDLDYNPDVNITPTQANMDSITKITALDKAMKNFVETNDPQALLHVFDVALKDDKQD